VALIEAANSAAGRTKTATCAPRPTHQTPARTQKAIVAVAHSILVSAYHVLAEGRPHEELGGDYFLPREDQARITQRLVRQLERLGQRVTLEPATLEAR
jgi:transposase